MYPPPVPWTVYVLVSETLHATYVGITTDAERRIDQHNGLAPGGAKTTRRGRPWAVGARFGPFEERGEAQRVESVVKRLRGRDRLGWQPPE